MTAECRKGRRRRTSSLQEQWRWQEGYHSSLGFARLVGATADDMTVHVTIGVPRPDKVNVAEVADTLPHGHIHVTVVAGGLELLNEDGSDGTLIANVIITVSIDDGK
jgi:uncharacterized protein (TIGR02058 family)